MLYLIPSPEPPALVSFSQHKQSSYNSTSKAIALQTHSAGTSNSFSTQVLAVAPLCVTTLTTFKAKSPDDYICTKLAILPNAVVTSSSASKVAQTPTTEPVAPQTDPNRDRFLQPAPVPLPAPVESEPEVSPTPTPEPSPVAPSVSISIRRIEVTGSTVFSPDEINSITKPFEGRSVSLEELQGVADAITQLYLNNAYITSRAILVDQTITDGVAQIRIIEGSLQEIIIEGTRRLNQSYIRSRIQRGAGTPLNSGKLEEQLRLLRSEPLFSNVESTLRAGNQLGRSILTVRVTEAKQFGGVIAVDNYSPPSVGSERLGLNLRYRNLTGIGDEIAGSYYFSLQGGADVFDFSYRVPLNSLNGTLELRAAPNRNEIVQSPFDEFGFRGEQELYEISYRQPLVRSPREELALSLGFTFQDGQTFVSEEALRFFETENRTRVIKFGQDYTLRDTKGAWLLRSQFSLGTGFFDATVRRDPEPDGRFLSWLGQVQRVQILGEAHLLIVQGDIQLTPDSLLPSQLFVIGGGQSVRGYRQNARSGDNGFRFSIEDRITVQRDEAGSATLQVAPFIDLGAVWNVADNPNNDFLPEQRFLLGAGLGLLWEPIPGFNVRLDYAPVMINLSDRGENAQDEGFYFSVNYGI